MKHRTRQLDVTEVSWTLRHAFSARLALEVPIRRPHPRIVQTADFQLVRSLIDDFRVFDLGNGVCFLMGETKPSASMTQLKETQLTISSGDKIPN